MFLSVQVLGVFDLFNSTKPLNAGTKRLIWANDIARLKGHDIAFQYQFDANKEKILECKKSWKILTRFMLFTKGEECKVVV